MECFTKEFRQRVIREFAVRHNGTFNPALFLQEVERTGSEHEAYEWFEWDDATAARSHRLRQAREFARDLKITFTVESVGRGNAISVRQAEAPFAVSPQMDRQKGGGYVLTDPTSPAHMAEIGRQAITDLQAWARRYDAVLARAGVTPTQIERITSALDRVSDDRGQSAA